jgi:pyruvate-ferredoxin/flavodoxin oxidoreductase
MTTRRQVTVDGNEAAASVAYRASEVIAIYPITPSSTMGELADEWAAKKQPNLWGTVPQVVEMQSEGGAAGAVHGALQGGALVTTFTASQGLLLMIPNMFKIAGELTPFAMHVAARTLATHALSIFGDHSDVMAVRQTGFALLASGSVQEAHDLALIAHAATLRARVPFLHFFDGFRTSAEVAKIKELTDDDLRAMLDDDLIRAHRERRLDSNHPVTRGTAQNPDTFFQAREAANPFYLTAPEVVQRTMDRFAALTGRGYQLFDYVGHPAPDRVIVVMGSGAEVVHETVEWMVRRGDRVGLIKVRLYRPFSASSFLSALPAGVRSIAVLDRTKEPGAPGEPLYMDVLTALGEALGRGDARLPAMPRVIGGRYGLSSKEFTPAMVVAVFDELGRPEMKNHFTLGITDDVTGTSLPFDRTFSIEPDDVTRCLFFGLGADGTVGANKNSIKIIGEETANYAQGYFVYDSKKSGQLTVSHLRFGPRPIRSSYLVSSANFIACHQYHFMDRYDLLEAAVPGAVFLLNAPFGPGEVFDRLSRDAQEQIVGKRLRMYVIDAARVAKESGMGGRINSIMQTAFFAISGVLPRDEAIEQIKSSIRKTYGRKGADVVQANFAAVDATLANLYPVPIPDAPTAASRRPPIVPTEAPDFVQRVTAVMMAQQGDLLPVSAFPPDGTWPAGTSQWEKRNLADEIPVWDPALCIQCNKCVLVCPHAAIRAKVVDPALLGEAPETFKSTPYRGPEFKGQTYLLQVAPEDCTGCSLCVHVCPVVDKRNPAHKALDMAPQPPLRESERENFAFFMKLPDPDRTKVRSDVKGTQFLRPLFEFSGACAGCGETPYLRLLTQLYGDRLLIANATGCSSIYGANLPTSPWTTGEDGRGPAWSNSLFEDNAEFGFGMRLALDTQADQARRLLRALAPDVGKQLAAELLEAEQGDEAGIRAQRERVELLLRRLAGIDRPEARRLALHADALVRKTVWIVGGDGWAYDIGYGGLDHVLAMGRDVNVLVLDTEVYSNTGGQQSKATPLGASARFAMAGKATPKKDLGMLAMTYGTVYVAHVAFGAKDAQTVQALREAESYPGTSLVIAYSPCINHGYDLGEHSLEQMRLAVESGYWPLYRYDPRRAERGLPPLQMDSAPPKVDLAEFISNETRFRSVEAANPERAKALLEAARREVRARYALYEQLAHPVPASGNGAVAPPLAAGGSGEKP